MSDREALLRFFCEEEPKSQSEPRWVVCLSMIFGIAVHIEGDNLTLIIEYNECRLHPAIQQLALENNPGYRLRRLAMKGMVAFRQGMVNVFS